MFRLTTLAFVLVLAAPCAAAYGPDLNKPDEFDRLTSASLACLSYKTPAERRECDHLPAVIKSTPALRSPTEGHKFMAHELSARYSYGVQANKRAAAAMKALGAPPVQIEAVDDANFREGLAVIDGDLARPGHRHAVTDNMEFLLGAVSFNLTLLRYDVIDPWLARLRTELQAELVAVPPRPGAVGARAQAARVARLAGEIETAWSDSLATRAKRTAAGGDAGAAAGQTSAAAEASALARRWQSRAEALDD